MHMGYQIVTCPMTSLDPQRCCEAVRSAILMTAWLLVYVFPVPLRSIRPSGPYSRFFTEANSNARRSRVGYWDQPAGGGSAVSYPGGSGTDGKCLSRFLSVWNGLFRLLGVVYFSVKRKDFPLN